MTATDEDVQRSRWRGQLGRLEVWYTTLTDPVTGTGVWLHHELVAPADGGPAWAHGWITVSEPGTRPLLRRFGPGEWPSPASGFALGEVRYDGAVLAGAAGEVSWRLEVADPSPRPLYTFPRWAWEHELLPAAQVVARPTAAYTGVVRVGDRELVLTGAPGADARIYGHGNARRWCWLHADLGDGEAVELVAAVSMRPGLDRLPPLPLVAFRLRDGDRPRDTLLAAIGLRARLRRDGFTVTGRLGRQRLRVEVDLPDGATVDVDYRDPDGAALLCRNSTLADATIRLGDRAWALDGCAHAEVGGFRGGVDSP